MTYGNAQQINSIDRAPQPPVHSALMEMDHASSRLHERIATLEQRLSTVLGPVPPASVAEGKRAEPRSLAQQIGAGAASFHDAANALDSIISRLEL